CAEHGVEVDQAVEEAPRHVAHHRAQKRIRAHSVRLALTLSWPGDGDEVLIALEAELAERERAVTGDLLRQLDLDRGVHVYVSCNCRSVIANLAPLLHRQGAEDGLLDHDARLKSLEAVCRALGQQRLVPALQADAAHALALRLALHLDGTLFSGRRD